jgi:hypothetical protein
MRKSSPRITAHELTLLVSPGANTLALVAKPVNVALKPTVVIPQVLAILLEPVNVALKPSGVASLDVAQKLFSVAPQILAVPAHILPITLNVPCIASHGPVTCIGGRRERNCRNNSHYSESYNAVDVGRSK